jgi:hypothetical protein
MPSIGSVTEGYVGAQLDLQQVQLNQAKLEMAPIELAKEQIALQQDKMQLAQQTKMLSLMQNLKPPSEADTPDQVAGVLSQISMIQAEAGLPDAAAKTAGEAASILNKSSQIDYRSWRMQNDRLSKFANVLSSVPDSPQGFALAIQTMAAEDPGVAKDPRFLSIARQPWRPGLIEQLQSSVQTAKDKAEVKLKAAQEAHARSSTVVDQHRVGLIDAQKDATRDRDKRLEKEGALVVKASQLKAITDQADRDFQGVDENDIRVRSRPLAEEMVKLMREQHLTESEAAVRVYQRAKKDGIFNGLRVPPTIAGSKPIKPLPKPDKPSQLKDNQWYMIKGQPQLYMDNQFYSQEDVRQMSQDEKDALGMEDEDEPDAD